MGILNGLFKRSEEKKPVDDVGYLSSIDFPDLFFEGYTPLSEHPEIVSAVDKVADLVSNMTIHLIEKTSDGKEKRVQNGLSRKLDINPNNDMTRKTFINNIVRNIMIHGNQYTEIEWGYEAGSRTKILKNLVPLRNDEVTTLLGKSGYAILKNGSIQNKKNILHFVMNPDINKPYVGKGNTIALKTLLDNLSIAQKTKKGYMSQKFSPSMVISVEVDAGSDPAKWKEKRQNLQNEYIESSEVGAPLIIPSSLMDVKSVKPLTLQDIAINESVEIDKKAVAAILGIPPYILGVSEFKRDEYNNFIENKIKSIATIIQQEMTRKIITSEQMFIRFNHHSLLDYSLIEWADIGKNLRAIGVMSGNEVRNKIGLEYDDTPELNEFVMLENFINVKDTVNQNKLEKGGD